MPMVAATQAASPARECPGDMAAHAQGDSVQVFILVILGALGRQLDGQPAVRDLADPDPRRDGHRALEGAAAVTGFRRGGGLPPIVQPELMNSFSALSFSNTQTIWTFLTPKPNPACSSTIFI